MMTRIQDQTKKKKQKAMNKLLSMKTLSIKKYSEMKGAASCSFNQKQLKTFRQ